MPWKATCFECGKEALHSHHVVPEVRGGTKRVPLCEICHGLVHDADMTISALIKEGMRKAAARGIKAGRPRILNHKAIQARFKKLALPIGKAATKMGLHRKTLRSILRGYYVKKKT